jgi:hypothetical protein
VWHNLNLTTGDLMMGEWAKVAFERLKQEEGSAHAENQRLALEPQRVLDTSLLIWDKIVTGMLEEVEDFSKVYPLWPHVSIRLWINSLPARVFIFNQSFVRPPA